MSGGNPGNETGETRDHSRIDSAATAPSFLDNSPWRDSLEPRQSAGFEPLVAARIPDGISDIELQTMMYARTTDRSEDERVQAGLTATLASIVAELANLRADVRRLSTQRSVVPQDQELVVSAAPEEEKKKGGKKLGEVQLKELQQVPRLRIDMRIDLCMDMRMDTRGLAAPHASMHARYDPICLHAHCSARGDARSSHARCMLGCICPAYIVEWHINSCRHLRSSR